MVVKAVTVGEAVTGIRDNKKGLHNSVTQRWMGKVYNKREGKAATMCWPGRAGLDRVEKERLDS